MVRKIYRGISISLVLTIAFQLFSCGTLMYPERRGQKSGEIDIKVALLDGIGLIFCIIPGVVAYIVDFTTGAIYLPAGRRNIVNSYSPQMRIIYLDMEKIRNPEYIREIIVREASSSSMINWDHMISYEINRNLFPEFAKLQTELLLQ